MDRRFILLKSISCRGVKSFNLFQKPSTYAVVSIAPKNENKHKHKHLKQKTQIDHQGGENPDWDQTIELDLDDTDFQNLFLEFAIMAQGNLLLFGDKILGKSRVPMSDLSLGFPISSDPFRHVSYQIRSPEGKPNGVLNFSYSLKFPEMETPIPPPMAPWIDVNMLPPAPAPARNSLYPSLQLTETEQEDCFCNYNQMPPLYYPEFDRGISSPVLSREGYFSPPVVESGGYYAPPPPPAAEGAAYYPPAAEGAAYYPPAGGGYIYPPPQASCGYWNCK